MDHGDIWEARPSPPTQAISAEAQNGDPSLASLNGCGEASPTAPFIAQTEFLVCPGGLCVPTEGELRVEEIRGVAYVIGHSTWERCESWAHARLRLAARIEALDPHELARDALLVDPFDACELV